MQATTFIARELTADEEIQPRILSSITLIGLGPMPNPINARFNTFDRPVLHWHVNGIFSHPEARRQGIAAALMDAAKQRALDEAEAQDGNVVLTVVVYTGNGAAKSWYEKMGFKEYHTGEDQGRPISKLFMILPSRSALHDVRRSLEGGQKKKTQHNEYMETCVIPSRFVPLTLINEFFVSKLPPCVMYNRHLTNALLLCLFEISAQQFSPDLNSVLAYPSQNVVPRIDRQDGCAKCRDSSIVVDNRDYAASYRHPRQLVVPKYRQSR